MERPEVFISHAEIQVESLGCLPRILEVKVVGVHYYPTLRVSHRDCRGGHVASKEVRQSILILANQFLRRIRLIAHRPRTLRSVERKLASSTAMVELIHVRLADFSSEAKLVRSPGIGNDISGVPGKVTAAFRRR